MNKNPFFYNGPIHDPPRFCNRKLEVKRVLEMLGKGQSVSLIGPRKIGKTSFLHFISQPEVMQQHGLDPTCSLIVYIDCKSLRNRNQESFYALILEAITEKASQQGYDFALPRHPISYLSFKRALSDILNRKFKLVLLLDDFEALSENHRLDQEFFAGLRALTARFDVAYVTTSQRPLFALSHTKECLPFFSILVPLRLRLFDEGASRRLIEGYLNRAEAAAV